MEYATFHVEHQGAQYPLRQVGGAGWSQAQRPGGGERGSVLEAHASLLRDLPPLLASMFPGLTVEPKGVAVLRVAQESPFRELFAYSVVIAYQKELEDEVPPLIEDLLGVPVPESMDTLVTVLVMLVAIYGISKVFDRLFPGRDRAALDTTREGLLQRAARLSGVAIERIREAVAVLVNGQRARRIVTASQKAFAPTRGQTGAAIRTAAGVELVSPAAVTQAQAAAGMPYEPALEEIDLGPPAEFMSRARIIVHAMDRDRQRRGWAGHCPGKFDARIPMHLEKSLDPAAIYGRTEIEGDILLSYVLDADGEAQAKEFLLLRVYP